MKYEPTLQLPAPMSTFATAVDDTYYLLFWMSVGFFVVITGTAIYFLAKYKRREGVKAEPTGHNTTLEVAWTIAPVFVLVYLFVSGFKGYLDLAVAPSDAIPVRVRGFQWGWDFEYPNGAHTDVLRAPVGKPVKLTMSSNDVLHSFYVPQFRLKKDLVPGMYTSVWFQATEVGEADLFCAEYCGGRSTETSQAGHWSMIKKVMVEPVESFDKFMKEGGGKPEGLTVAEWGEQLYKAKACVGCHSIDGSKGAGPTWKAKFGAIENFADGTTGLIDENYLRESILEPQAKLVAGFGPVMPTYKGILNDKEVDALIEYIKTLK